MKLYVTADDAFKAYINGNFVKDGNDWSQTYSVDVTAYVKPCEKNYLRIWAQNTPTMSRSPAMISYRLEATGGCNNSPPPGVYYQDGQCKCANRCEGCDWNWTWSPAPDCECICHKRPCKFLRPGAGRNVHAKVSSSKKKFKFKLPSNTHDSIPLSTSIISCENKKFRHYYFMKILSLFFTNEKKHLQFLLFCFL